MRRPFATALAVLAAVTQLLLATATPLGLVLCLGDGHAGIELASEECCGSHGHAARSDAPTLARSCCSDVPLHAAVPSLTDALRVVAAGSGVVAAVLPARTPLAHLAHATVDPSSPTAAVRRTIVLRV